MEVSIERSTGGNEETVASAFTHLNNAWHDSGVHFSNISLPINSHVNYGGPLESINYLENYCR